MRRQLLATTYVDRHNMKLDKTVLEQAAIAMNGPNVPMLGIEHDLTLPPAGKWIKADLEKFDDGEYGLFGEHIFYDESLREEAVLSNGSKVIIESYSDKRPFIKNEKDIPDEIRFSYDIVNFENNDDIKDFDNYVLEVGGVSSGELVRKSLIPDPELIITLSKSAITAITTYAIFKKTGQKLSNEFSNDLLKVYTTIRDAAFDYAKRSFPKNRPITYILIENNEFEKEYVVQTTDPKVFDEAIKVENIEDVFKKSEYYKGNFDVEKIQFIFIPETGWEFNYLLTSSGQVVGSPDAIKRRENAVQLQLKKQLEGKD